MIKNTITILIVAAVAFGSIFVVGCESGAQTGAGLGALAGAGIGQLAGGSTEATLIGAAIGGGAGYMFGNEADKKNARAERAYIREEMNYETVNMTNSNGSISQVKLRKQGVGYVGTRGEYYAKLPTSEELRPIYGF